MYLRKKTASNLEDYIWNCLILQLGADNFFTNDLQCTSNTKDSMCMYFYDADAFAFGTPRMLYPEDFA